MHKLTRTRRIPGSITTLLFSRFGRSLQDLISGGRLVFHSFAALAEFIRELIIDGTE